MSTLKCHRCEKICTSKGGLTNHIIKCIDKSKKMLLLSLKMILTNLNVLFVIQILLRIIV